MIAGYIRNRRLQKKIDAGELESFPEVKEVDAECCGPARSLWKRQPVGCCRKKIEYYDDEELDRFIGRAPEAYTDDEIEMFRARILYHAGDWRSRMGAESAITAVSICPMI